MRLIGALVVVLGVAAGGSVDRGNEGVTTESGTLLGIRDGETLAWKGVAFAAAPVGERRFRSPELPRPWKGMRKAESFGEQCVQFAAGSSSTVVGGEDCLTLNVWRPAKPASANLAVMVFLHGGSFVRGDGRQNGAWLAEHSGAIVVTVQYRLGPLGFLADPGLEKEDPRANGNAGVLDQLAALRWVSRNIHAFGGDPAHVLLFGHSAGALSVAALLALPEARGLFSAALLQSPGTRLRSSSSAVASRRRLGTAAGCNGKRALECLRSKDASDVFRAAAKSGELDSEWAPTLDGALFAHTPMGVFASGDHSHVPVIIGTTGRELRGVASLARRTINSQSDFESAIADLGHSFSETLRLYPPTAYSSRAEAFAAARSDEEITCPSLELARVLSWNQEEPVRRYRYMHTFETIHSDLGPFHGADVLLLFHDPQITLSKAEEALAAQMARYWGRFAAKGDPNGSGDPAWEPFNVTKRNYLSIDTPAPSGATGESAACEYWTPELR